MERLTYVEVAGHCKRLAMSQTQDGEWNLHGILQLDWERLYGSATNIK